MFGVCVCCPENVTLLGGPNYKCYIKSQPFEVAHDEAIVTKRSTRKVGHTAIPIWDALLPQKAVKGQVLADFLAEHPDLRGIELYEDLPDEVAEVCLTQTSFERQVW